MGDVAGPIEARDEARLESRGGEMRKGRFILRFSLSVTLALAALFRPLAAEAQSPARNPRLCLLGPYPLSHPSQSSRWSAFLQALRDLGYVEGSTVTIDFLSSDAQPNRFPGLAAECVRRRPDVIVTLTTPAALAAKQATSTIPIVMASSGDPVGAGIVTSLPRPGGNVTGLTVVAAELSAKRLELLKEMVPGLSRVVIVSHLVDPIAALQVKETEQAARSLGLRLQHHGIRTLDDLAGAFAAAATDGAQALLITVEQIFVIHRARVLELAARHRLPTMYPLREFVEDGGLMSYGVDPIWSFRKAAVYVDKILKGVKPADLPVEQVTTFEFAINFKTAKALGLTIPPSLMLRADQVIR